MINCINCKTGINGDKSCGSGAFNTSPELGCFLGEELPNTDPNKGKIPKRSNDKFYERTCDGTTQIHRARKKHTCDFCGRTIYPNEEYYATFVRRPQDTYSEQRFLKSCKDCNGTIIYMFGD